MIKNFHLGAKNKNQKPKTDSELFCKGTQAQKENGIYKWVRMKDFQQPEFNSQNPHGRKRKPLKLTFDYMCTLEIIKIVINTVKNF